MDIAIEAKGLQKRFPRAERAAVHDLDLEIPRGQLFGLVGPDGAGKTTALRMLASVMEPSGGDARIAGRDVRKEPEQVRRRIGYMPQNFSLYPDLNVIENLNFFADIYHVPAVKKESRIADMLAFTHLEPFRERRAGKLSGGMKKKLALACALVHSPEILLLDEPSTGVDPVSRQELWRILTEVVQQGVTVMLSTPYMDEAERCHQVGMLYDGHLLTSGTPAELIGRLPFSIIEVKAKPRKEMRRVVTETGGIQQWRTVGDRLRLSIINENGNVKTVLKTLDQRFKKEKLEVVMLRAERPDMEDVFVNLVSDKRVQHE
ncbi:MAG TPA: ABC transporter ATP-binding protein [Longilinea sp.]|nr:ABC transporter ATP-binding protein [Longilinea sp.]